MTESIIRYINRILKILNLPVIDLLKIRQKLIYYKIRKNVSKSIRVLRSTLSYDFKETLNESTPIYVMWWTGEETMPPIVKLCYANLLKNTQQHPITLITKENYHLILPSSIVKNVDIISNMYDSGKICIQHLSDIIRTLILNKIGGIWIDATVFVTPNWDKDLIGKPFYSGRRTNLFANSGKSITQGQWTSYLIASVKGNPLINFIYDGLNEYYSQKGEIDEYYTMDYLFAIAMKESPIIRNIITKVPQINANLFSLEAFMFNSFDEKEYKTFMETAPFYKLNHRIEYLKYDNNKNLTVFGYLSSIY